MTSATETSDATPRWTLAGNEVRLESPGLRAKVWLDRVSGGLSEIIWNRQLALCRPLQLLCNEGPRVEAYIRGNDLVSTYESRLPHGAPQIYWRLHAGSPPAIGVEVVLSMRTELLDSQPLSAVDSMAADVRAFHSTSLDATDFAPVDFDGAPHRWTSADAATHLFALRSERLKMTYAEMVHPSDFVSAVLSKPEPEIDSWHLKSVLFPESLEKGVIRRARICGWFLPAENDLAVAVQLARKFIEEPLPLTT